MKVVILYIVVPSNPAVLSLATRFTATLGTFDAGHPYEVMAVCNDGNPDNALRIALSIVRSKIFRRSNDGWDIGAYLELSREFPDDTLLVCCGESVYFHKPGWLNRLVSCWEQHGEGMYGVWASRVVRPHLLTTAFATSARLLKTYPLQPRTKRDRYNFEHGPRPFYGWVESQRLPVKLVTWDGCYSKPEWRSAPNILWRGDQSNCLMFCNHTDRYQRAGPAIKRRWAMLADAAK